MHRIGRAHPVIQIHVEALERLVEKRAHLVGIGLGCESLGERGAANLVAVLVRAAQERYVIAAELAALITREDIGGQRLVGAADMRDTVAVKNRGSDMDTIGHRNSKRPKRRAESSASVHARRQALGSRVSTRSSSVTSTTPPSSSR